MILYRYIFLLYLFMFNHYVSKKNVSMMNNKHAIIGVRRGWKYLFLKITLNYVDSSPVKYIL